MKKLMVMTMVSILFLFTAQTVMASSLDFIKEEVVKSGTLADGINYENFTAKTYTDYGTEGIQNISIVKALSSSDYKIVSWSKLGDKQITKANMIDIARDFELHNPGYEVLAGINGDYYNMTDGTPVNALVQQGDVIKYNNFNLERYFSVGFTNDEDLYVSNKLNELESTFTLTIYDEDGMLLREFPLKGMNTIPRENETSVYFKALNTFVVTGATMVAGDVTKNVSYGSTNMKGTIEGVASEVVSGEERFTVVTKNSVVESYLQAGYKVRVQKKMDGVYSGIDNIIGVGSQPLLDNTIKAFEDINDQNVDFAKARSPRSSFGFTSDGDFIIAAIDGRQENMAGANLRELAQIMNELGCVNAFNLDGGGSTQLVIRENENFTMLNSPSDNPYRRVSNGILIVRPKVEHTIEVSNEKETGFDFQVLVTPNFQLEKYEVFVDNAKYQTSDTIQYVTDLENVGTHSVSIKFTMKSGLVYTSSRQVDLREYVVEEPVEEKKIPSNFVFDVKPDYDKDNIDVFVSFDDPNNTFVKMYVIVNEEKMLVKKSAEGYKITIENAVESEVYSLKLEVYYVLGTIVPTVLTPEIEETFTYTNSDNVIDDNTDENNDYVLPISIGIVVLVSIGTIVVYAVKRKRI